MKAFMDKDFLLETETAQKLYHEFSAPDVTPVIDYHCHINPKEIWEDRKFENITQVWLGGDHYKWRFMRSCGVDEKYITGDASDYEKFCKWAECVGKAIGNPLFHWSHLELQRYFGYHGHLNKKTADEVNLEAEKDKDYYEDKYEFLDEMIPKTGGWSGRNIETGVLLEGVNMTDYTKWGDWKVLCHIIATRYQVSLEDAAELLHQLMDQDSGIKRRLMQALIHSKNQRELEQIIFSFEIPISLAVLTHITRHRMHSLLVPDFVPLWNLENYVIPKSFVDGNREKFIEAFAENKTMVDKFKNEYGIRDEDLVYFYLSGNACNIYTTMNGRTLEWISRMRCCNKAQWEIRNIANSMVEQAKRVTPLVGEGLGPYCKVMGYCPEGKDSCKARGVVTLGDEPEDAKS